MNKWFKKFLFIFLIAGLLTACTNESENTNTTVSTNNTSDTEEVAKDSVRITISINEGEQYVTEEEIQIEEGDILMDVMKENFYIETDQDGQFITSIERVAASEEDKTAWMYFVNGELATVGAGEYELTPGDVIEFDLQSWEQ